MNIVGVRVIDPNNYISKAQIKKIKEAWKNKDIDEIEPKKREILHSVHYINVDFKYDKLRIYKNSKENINVFSFYNITDREKLLEKLKNKTSNNRLKGPEWHMYNTLKDNKIDIMSPSDIKKDPTQCKHIMEMMEKINQTNNKLYEYYKTCSNKE